MFLPNQCPGNVVYWAKEYFRLPIYVPQGVTLNRRMVAVIKVNDVGLHGLIDTGTGETTMRPMTALTSHRNRRQGEAAPRSAAWTVPRSQPFTMFSKA